MKPKVLAACRFACRLALGLMIVSAGGCLALMARGATTRAIIVRAPCACGWAQPVPVAGSAVPSSEGATGPR